MTDSKVPRSKVEGVKTDKPISGDVGFLKPLDKIF